MIRKNDYEVMEVLVNGKWVEADVLKTLSDGTCLYLMGSKTLEGSYTQGGAIPADGYRPIDTKPPQPKTEIRVKSKMDIIKTLIADGYEIDDRLYWRGKGSAFVPDMFKYCGKLESDSWVWEKNWLEEVEIIE